MKELPERLRYPYIAFIEQNYLEVEDFIYLNDFEMARILKAYEADLD